MIRFVVPAIPVAQPRQRTRVVGKGGRYFAHNYTPTSAPVNAFKAAVQQAAAAVYSGPPLEGPIALAVLFVLPRPKRLLWKTRPMPRDWQPARPDEDNLSKAVRDALEGILWRNDSQICLPLAAKMVAAGREQPHVVIQVQDLTDVACPFQPGPSSTDEQAFSQEAGQ